MYLESCLQIQRVCPWLTRQQADRHGAGAKAESLHLIKQQTEKARLGLARAFETSKPTQCHTFSSKATPLKQSTKGIKHLNNEPMGVILIRRTTGCPSFGTQKIVNEYQLSNTELQKFEQWCCTWGLLWSDYNCSLVLPLCNKKSINMFYPLQTIVTCKPSKPFPPQDAFGHGACHSNRKQTGAELCLGKTGLTGCWQRGQECLTLTGSEGLCSYNTQSPWSTGHSRAEDWVDGCCEGPAWTVVSKGKRNDSGEPGR